jgi:hypothetical protein
MYPYKVYCSKPEECRYTLYPVLVTGYALAISASAFKGRVLSAGYKASRKHKSLEVYQCLPTFMYDHQIQDELAIHKEMSDSYPNRPFIYKLQEKEYELLDFYKEIGYDKSTGKINGRTLAQHIKHFMKEIP